MTTSALSSPAAAPAGQRARLSSRQTLGRAVRSEWGKLTTLRSTWVTSLLTILLTVGMGVGITLAYANLDAGSTTAWNNLPSGTAFGEIVVAVLGALAITGEYSSGQIRSSLAAVPRRGRLLTAKVVVVAVWSFLLGAASILLAWAIATPFMRTGTIPLTDHRMLGYVWGTGLAFAGIALLSLGLGLVLRSTAGTITVVVCLLFVVTIPLSLLSIKWEWVAKVNEVLPPSTVNAVIDPFSNQVQWADTAGSTAWLTHTAALGVFAAWVLVPLAIGWVVFTRRDA